MVVSATPVPFAAPLDLVARVPVGFSHLIVMVTVLTGAEICRSPKPSQKPNLTQPAA